MFPENEFIEIFVDADIDTVISRDPKGLYQKALSGKYQTLLVLVLTMRSLNLLKLLLIQIN